jgi:Ubiquitin carboxyl-terminal hydrolase
MGNNHTAGGSQSHQSRAARFEKSKQKAAERNNNAGKSTAIASTANAPTNTTNGQYEQSEFDNPATFPAAFALTNTHKGLTNFAGENNCFLNVTIQALWHVGPFRVELQRYISSILAAKVERATHGSVPEAGDFPKMELLKVLCNLFVQYEFTSLDTLPPNELRVSLSQISSQFKLGEFADANETLGK